MGNYITFLSRQNDVSQNETPATGGNGFRYPPKNGGNFFSNSFVMGGEKFDSQMPEQYLFGDNTDLNFLNPPIPFPYPAPTSTEPTKTLKALINIRKESLKLVKIPTTVEQETTGLNLNSPSSESPAVAELKTTSVNLDKDKDQVKNRYNIEFIFDADCRCEITIMYFCTEEITSSGVTYKPNDPKMNSDPVKYKAGPNQTFVQTEHIICPANFPESDLKYDFSKEIFPVVISCVALEGDEPRQSHITTATIERHFEAIYAIKPLKQKLFIDGLVYLLQEIYGIENKTNTTTSTMSTVARVNKLPLAKDYGDGLESNNENEFGNNDEPSPVDDGLDDSEDENSSAECVICMSDMKDTITLPCRHLALCASCADSLRYQASNCPICRAPFRALLQIRAVYRVPVPIDYPTAAIPTNHMNPIIPGYEIIPLLEALNGPYQSDLTASSAVTALSTSTRQEAVHKLGDNRRRTSNERDRELNPMKVMVAPINNESCTTTTTNKHLLLKKDIPSIEEGVVDELDENMKTTVLTSQSSSAKDHITIVTERNRKSAGSSGSSSAASNSRHHGRHGRNKTKPLPLKPPEITTVSSTTTTSSNRPPKLSFITQQHYQSQSQSTEFDPTSLSPISPPTTTDDDYDIEDLELDSDSFTTEHIRRLRKKRMGKKKQHHQARLMKKSFEFESDQQNIDPNKISASVVTQALPGDSNLLMIASIDEFSDNENECDDSGGKQIKKDSKDKPTTTCSTTKIDRLGKNLESYDFLDHDRNPGSGDSDLKIPSESTQSTPAHQLFTQVGIGISSNLTRSSGDSFTSSTSSTQQLLPPQKTNITCTSASGGNNSTK